MVAKIHNNTCFSISCSIKIILVTLAITGILFILYHLYYPTQQFQESKKPTEVKEALLNLEEVRKTENFAWPVAIEKGAEPELVKHTSFSLAYQEAHEQAAWVAYLISRKHAHNASKRRDNFRTDPSVSTGSASSEDYKYSGFDRGHLAPAADFDYNRKALSETFFMSNISPQHPSFNRGGWRELEEVVRQWATEQDSLWVVTGPILERELKEIGSNGVSVPKYFYKIILDARQPDIKLIGFLMPNQKLKQDLGNFIVPIDSIEKISGLDFFPQVPDLLEDSLEREIQFTEWFNNEKK